LIVWRDGLKTQYDFPHPELNYLELEPGDTMQWFAGEDGITIFEECHNPKYADGRFKDIAPVHAGDPHFPEG